MGENIKSDIKKNAFKIGIISIVIYFANYYMRHILGVLTPELLVDKVFTKSYIGLLSSTYMFCYALGQLINGSLGDIFNPKKIAFSGLFFSGVFLSIFPFMPSSIFRLICFAGLGFGLSTTRGPMMKIITENTTPQYARIICVFFSASSFAGPIAASIFAYVFNWKYAFVAAGITAICFSIFLFLSIGRLEKKNIVKFSTKGNKKLSSALEVFKIDKFVFFLIIACIVEIAATSITFWIPTYLSEKLLFKPETSNMIFSVIAIIRASTPFITLFFFNITNKKDVPIIKICFFSAAICFILLTIVGNKWANIIFLIIALFLIGCVSSVLWSIYIPSTGKTKRVSSLNGVLDCTGYVAAGITNIVFANLMNKISWNGIAFVWSLIALWGLISTYVFFHKGEVSSFKE